MADQAKIQVKFQAVGEKALVHAIKQLHASQILVQKGVRAYNRELKKLNITQQQQQKFSIFGFKNNRLLSNSFATLRSKMLLAAFAMTLFSRTVGRAANLAGEQELAQLKLEAVLGRVSIELLDYASALQKVTRFGDEAIISVQSIIGAFIKDDDVIKSLTKATLDLASAKGMDLNAAADLVAKSVGSSTNALTRYGIAANGAVGSTERAASVVRNISVLYGGMATKEAQGYAGTIDSLKNTAGDAAEAIGETLTGVIIHFSNRIQQALVFTEMFYDGLNDILGFTQKETPFRTFSEDIRDYQKEISKVSFKELETRQEALGFSFQQTTQDIDGQNITMQDSALTQIKLDELTKEKIKRESKAQALLQSTGYTQLETTKATEAWIIANQDAFESTEAYQSTLGGLQKVLKKQQIAQFQLASGAISSFGQLAEAAGAGAQQVANIQAAAAVVDAIAAAMSSRAMVSDILPPPAPDIAFGVSLVSGLAKAAMVQQAAGKVKSGSVGGASGGGGTRQIVFGQPAPQFADGGLIGGRPHSQGGTMINAERGEFIMSRNAVDSIGLDTLNNLNQGGTAVTVNVSGNVMTQDFVDNDLADAIKDAVRRGSDFGIG